jgi:hypothetical protein
MASSSASQKTSTSPCSDDLNEPASVEELQTLSNKKRRAKLDAIRDACRAYIKGRLLGAQLADATGGAGRVEIDEADPDGQASVGVVS